MVNTSKTDWGAAKAHFIATNLEPGREKPYTLKELAADWDVSYDSVRDHSAKEGWSQELTDAVADRDSKAIALLAEDSSFDEYEVRSRHATVGRFMIARGVAKIQTIEPEQLSIKEAIEMTRLGIEMERKSVGIKDGALFIGNVSINTFNWHEAHDRLSDFLMTLDDDAIDDVEFEEVPDGSF